MAVVLGEPPVVVCGENNQHSNRCIPAMAVYLCYVDAVLPSTYSIGWSEQKDA